MITGYKLLSDVSADTLAAQVRRLMKDGWQPQGGVSWANGEYWQAIVKFAE